MNSSISAKTRRIAFMLVPLAFMVTAPSLAAQTSGGVTGNKHDCQTAKHILAKESRDKNTPHPEQASLDLRWASAIILSCGDDAADAIGDALLNAPVGSTADTIAFNAAWELSDKRLLESVRGIARNTTLPMERRRQAVALLTRYAEPSTSLILKALTGDFPFVLASVSDSDPSQGAQPLTSADRLLALETMRIVGSTDPDPALRRLATLAAEQLKALVPGAP